MQNESADQRFPGVFAAVNDGVILSDAMTGLVVEANDAASKMHGYSIDDFVGLAASAYIHADSLPEFKGWLQKIAEGENIVAIASHLHADGSLFTIELSGSPYHYQDRLYLLSVVRDVSGRVDAEQLLRQEMAARTREQSTLLEISQTLASGLELDPGLILDQLRAIIDYTYAVLFTLEELDLIALSVRGSQRLHEAMPFRISLAGRETLTALLKGHLLQQIDGEWQGDADIEFFGLFRQAPATMLLEGVRAWMWVPLAVKGKVVGGMGIAYAEVDSVSTHQANLALTMANQAAITMVNAQLYEHAQSLATLQERQRLAQNLHDAVNQSLFSAALIAEVLPRLWEQDRDAARGSLEDLRRLTRGALAEMRGLLAELRPQVLIDSELGDLLRQLGNAFTGRSSLPVNVVIDGHAPLPAEVQVVFYRLCQEALINIGKHSRASEVDIQLIYIEGLVTLTITDNGRGFDPTQTPSGHYGLSMMRERAEANDLQLSINSELGQGTEIIIRRVENDIESSL